MIENHYDNWRLEAENDYSLYDFYPSETSDSEAYFSLLTAVVEDPEAVFSVESDFPVLL